MSITKERLKWLQKNKEYGEVSATVKKMNDAGQDITYTEALAIINGTLWGAWGKLFTDALESLILERINSVKAEKEKYTIKS